MLPVAIPVLAALLATWIPVQDRAPFSTAVSVSEAIGSPGIEQLICGTVTGARSATEEFGTILRFSEPVRDAHILVVIPNADRRRFGALIEKHLLDRLVCLRAVVLAMPGGPVIELSGPERIRFVSAPPPPEADFFRGISVATGATMAEPTEPRNPIYAPRARAALVQGDAEVLVRIDADGHVEAARILQPLDPVLGLDGEALAAALLWRFRPARQGTVGVPSVATVVMGFDLGVSRTARTDLVVQRSGQAAVQILQSPVSAEDPFATGASVGGSESLPSLWWYGVPAYSFEALKAGVEGSVGLDIVVAADGTVTRARVAESLAGGAHGLDALALAAVEQWQFIPGDLAGQHVLTLVRLNVEFALITRDDHR